MLSRSLMLVVVFVTLILIKIHKSRAVLGKPGCQETCGNVTIPYPFGIGTGCYLHNTFEVLCNGSSQDPYPLRFANTYNNFAILEFSTDLVRVIDDVTTAFCVIITTSSFGYSLILDQYLSFSQAHNVFVAVGCNISAQFYVGDLGSQVEFGCESVCNETIPATISATGCTGFNGCCQLSIPKNITTYSTIINYNYTPSSCAHTFIAENNTPIYFGDAPLIFPVALSWVVATTACHEASKTGANLCGRNSYCVDSTNSLGYNCHCKQGYQGNPYLYNGCQVTIETVIGLLSFGAIASWTCIKLGEMKKIKIKKKFFKKNGGHLLKEHISTNKLYVSTIEVYTVEEMEKATKKFNSNRFLGKGGQGSVYKGLFPDGTYLANDTLSQHLHDGAGPSKFSWKDRIRIAREVAGALAYLHSYASPAIFHRDIKPDNILLDQNYKALISDFGLSRPAPFSISHLTTQVNGTFGYLDPEYFQSGKLTAKSDVYSFGVVLTELLTRKKSISSSDSGEGLVPRFKYMVKHSQLVEILDKQVMQEAMMEEVIFVAKLAKRCMKTNSKKRPSMEEVVSNLDRLRVVQLEIPQECIIEHKLTTNLP
ncbi:hypothetical protein E3N88_36825 [Mikania micrantha]|uniref:Protein kinase domain-containing protein n=1 Tax=Mikania micrantha TaxID=192012 RepID=A0A5N6M4W3_9ASTR|nr:hypothetical protein E3N88_36825 [Mikania micrantha]